MESLVFYDYQSITALTNLDLGTIAPASSDDTVLRVYNTSDTYQAEDVSITITGDDAIQLWISTDGDTFGASLNLGDIPPNALSPTFWLRRVTASTEPDGPRDAVLNAVPSSWAHPIDTSTTDNVPLDTEES